MASVDVSVHKSAGTAVAGPGRLPLRLGSPNPGLYGAASLCLKSEFGRATFRLSINCPPFTGRTIFGARRSSDGLRYFCGAPGVAFVGCCATQCRALRQPNDYGSYCRLNSAI